LPLVGSAGEVVAEGFDGLGAGEGGGVGADLRLSPFVACIAEVDDDRQDAERNDEEDRSKDQDDASLIVCTSKRDHGAAAETVHHDQSAPVGGVSSPPVSVLL
jgi:hypothetical protein